MCGYGRNLSDDSVTSDMSDTANICHFVDFLLNIIFISVAKITFFSKYFVLFEKYTIFATELFVTTKIINGEKNVIAVNSALDDSYVGSGTIGLRCDGSGRYW
jgi:hypothetical protein